MALDRVGGEYIIKGNTTDPRLTSSGQSWANLLTSEKYKLWQVANQEAMRQLQTEQMNAQQRQQRVDQLRQDLQRQRASTQQGINALRTHQLDAIGASDTATWKEQQQRGRGYGVSTTTGSGSGSGSGGRGKTVDVKRWENEQSTRRRDVRDAVQESIDTKVRGENSAFVKEAYKQRAKGGTLSQEQDNAIQKYTNENPEVAKAIESDVNRLKDLNEKIEIYNNANAAGKQKIIEESFINIGGSGGSGSGSGSRTTVRSKAGVEPVTDAPVQDYTSEIERQEKRLRDIEQQLLNLENEEIPVGDAIRGTRKLLKTKFGEGNYSEPTVEPVRQQDFRQMTESDIQVQPGAFERQERQDTTPTTVEEEVVTEDDIQFQPSAVEFERDTSPENRQALIDQLMLERIGTPQNVEPPVQQRTTPVQAPSQVEPEFLPSQVEPEFLPSSVLPIVDPRQPLDERLRNVDLDLLSGIDPSFPTEPDGTRSFSAYSAVMGKEELELHRESILKLNDVQYYVDYAIAKPSLFDTNDPGIAAQLAGINLLQRASEAQYSHPVEYKQFVNEVNDYVFEKLNPTQAKSYNIARSIVESQNIDERNIYKQVKGATKKQNELLLSILNETYSSVLTELSDNLFVFRINDAYDEAIDTLTNANVQAIITNDEYSKIQEMLNIWKYTALRLADENSAQRSITGE